MNELWKIAFGITGFFGVASFIIYSLYKEWLKKIPLLSDLTKSQKYNLAKLFLLLTFLFGLLGALLMGYKMYLTSKQIESSFQELKNTVSSKYEYGQKKLEEISAKSETSSDERAKVEKLKSEYTFLANSAKDALEKGQLNRFHDLTNQINELLRTNESREILKEIPADSMCWQPPSSNDIFDENFRNAKGQV